MEPFINIQPAQGNLKYIIALVDGAVLMPLSGADHPYKFLLAEDRADHLRVLCQHQLTVGEWQGHAIEVWDLDPQVTVPKGYQLEDLRSLLFTASTEVLGLVSRATQLLNWYKTHRFCGSCGKPMIRHASEYAMRCESCNRDDYPRISPCIIVVVTHGDKCLLARQAHWPPGRYSAIAGFIEIGETAEQAVCREVYEEVGLEIDSVRYISSQPWPFPSQLMMGFIARAKTTEIEVDGVEISEAHWWHYQQLPEFIPPANVIAGELIRKFVSEVAQ